MTAAPSFLFVVNKSSTVSSRHLKQEKKWQARRRPVVEQAVISMKCIGLDLYCRSWAGITYVPWILFIVWGRGYVWRISLPGSVQTRQRKCVQLATRTLILAGWSSACREQNLSTSTVYCILSSLQITVASCTHTGPLSRTKKSNLKMDIESISESLLPTATKITWRIRNLSSWKICFMSSA